MANKALLVLAVLSVFLLCGCQEPVVKAGVAPPKPEEAGRMSDSQKNTRGGLGLPKQLPKGPY